MKSRTSLRLIVIFSLTAVSVLACFSVFYISPLYSDLIIKNAEIEAVKVARHMSEPLRLHGTVGRELPEDFILSLQESMENFGLERIKVFSPQGETVYSSTGEDIGTVNKNDYFHDIVARGGVFSKYVKRDSKTLEGRIASRDVVETYVPIMHGHRFAGAFELYLDITREEAALAALLLKSHLLLLFIAVCLSLAILVVAFFAKKFLLRQEAAEREIIQQNLVLQEINDKLQATNNELDLLFNFTPVIVCTAGTDGYFKSVNPAMEKILGYSRDELLARPLLDFVHPEDRNPEKKESPMQIDGRRIRTFQNRYRCRDGSHRLLEWTTTSAVDDVLYAAAKDITERKLIEEEREKLIAELRKALDEIKTLQGIIPICMYCKKIKSDEDVWDQLEVYLEEHSEADFSHGCCPDCYRKMLKEIQESK